MMHFFKNRFWIFFIILLFFCIFLFLNFKNDTCSYDNCIITSSSFVFSNTSISNLQSKLSSIYKNEEKVAYLTFDDGPTKIATPKILEILRKYEVHASFFVIGYRVNEFPNIVKQAYEEGHFIANHGYSHKNSILYRSKEDFFNEIKQTDNAIANAIGCDYYCSHIFRFPNGSTSNPNNEMKKYCKNYLSDFGYAYVDWNALNNDSIKKYSSSQLLSNLKKSCKNKQSLIILMHDTSDVSKSYEALEDSILYLKSERIYFSHFCRFNLIYKEYMPPNIFLFCHYPSFYKIFSLSFLM